MIHRLVELAKSTDGGRVRSVSLVAVLDRARLKPIDFGPSEDKPSEPKFDPPLYSSNEFDLIEWVLRMMLAPRQALPAAEAEDASDDGSRNWREGTRAAQICSKSNIREG